VAVLARQNNPLAKVHFLKSIECFERLESKGGYQGIEFALLELGKFLVKDDAEEAAKYIGQALEVLEKRDQIPPTQTSSPMLLLPKFQS